MVFIKICLFLLFLLSFFKSFIATLDYFKAKNVNDYPWYFNFVIIWLIPFWGAYKITKQIAQNGSIERKYNDSPLIDLIPGPDDFDLDID